MQQNPARADCQVRNIQMLLPPKYSHVYTSELPQLQASFSVSSYGKILGYGQALRQALMKSVPAWEHGQPRMSW